MLFLVSGDVNDFPLAADPESIVSELQALARGEPVTQSIPASVRVLSNALTVVHVPNQQVFTVSGPPGHVHAVRLFPKQSCTCPASTTCCHVLAAKRSIGMDCAERKLINLTQLRRNSRLISTFHCIMLHSYWLGHHFPLHIVIFFIQCLFHFSSLLIMLNATNVSRYVYSHIMYYVVRWNLTKYCYF